MTHLTRILGLVLMVALHACQEDHDASPEGRYVVTAIGGRPSTTDAAGRALCQNLTSRLLIKDRMDQPVSIFNPGEEIRFELAVTNHSNSPQTLQASASCTTAYFEVTGPGGERLWNNVDGVFCIMAQAPQTYAPHETIGYDSVWTQDRRDSGNPPPSLPNELPECRAALTKSAAFVIR